MRISVGLAVIAAVVVLAAVLVVGQALIQPPRPLITFARFSPDVITPNADGDADVTEFSYGITRNARISLSFVNENGQQFFFRQNDIRAAADYQVLFSGVVDGFTLPGEKTYGEVLRRLIPDGRYTWTLTATDTETGASEQQTGTLVVTAATVELPEMTSFSLSPQVFTPNQDGIEDRVSINIYLNKDADLTVYLEDATGQQIFIPESREANEKADAGGLRHAFDYDGGIDRGVDPPPDGDYTVVAIAQDREGQSTRRTASLRIESGGTPQAEISPQPNGIDVAFTVVPWEDRFLTTADQTGDLLPLPNDMDDLGFQAISLPIGDLLVFKLTVENYGEVPIRTSGPWPGTVYEQDQIWGALGVYEQSGAWRVGLQCSTSSDSFPWRWAIGTPDTLTQQVDAGSGNTYYYLPPGERSVVWGAVRMTRLIEARNPQQCWAGLIHEDVGISVRNARVGARDITLIEQSTQDG